MLPLLYSFQTKWTSTLTSRMLFEAGFTHYYEDSDERYKDWVNANTYSITSQNTGMQYGAYPAGSQYPNCA